MSVPNASRPPGKTWSWLLVASLALNLLVVGTIVGAMVVSHRHGGPGNFPGGRMFMGDAGLVGYVRSLPRERRVFFRTQLDNSRQAMKSFRQNVRQAKADVSAALAAEPFDQARFEAAVTKLVAMETEARRRYSLQSSHAHDAH
jgi:uncharacterized membrane protein